MFWGGVDLQRTKKNRGCNTCAIEVCNRLQSLKICWNTLQSFSIFTSKYSCRNGCNQVFKLAFCWRRAQEFRAFLLVLYLSLPTFHFRGKNNEYSAQRGWRPLANMYHSRNHRIYREKSKARNEAPYAEVWIGKLRQNATRRTALRGVKF